MTDTPPPDLSSPIVDPDRLDRRRRCRGPGGRVISAFIMAGLILSQSGCASSILSPIGPVGDSERTILLDSVVIMLAIVIPTIAATLGVAWWFRASNLKATYQPRWAYSGRLELIVWSIPALVVLFLGGIAWIGSHDLDPQKPLKSSVKPIDVDVVALDWKWLFIYPEQNLASVNRLVAPVGAPLRLHITSASVLNVFFVPRLGSQIYAMNGMTSQLNLMASRQGVFPGLSAHFSGDGFAGMKFDLQVVTPGQFDVWASQVHEKGGALDDVAYRGLLKQTQNVVPYTYRAVRAGLFDDIVRQMLPSGDGPKAPQPRAQAPGATQRRT